MNWYYADAGQQKGPVSEAELTQLFQSGQITGATLVWKDGMANWESYSKVLGTPAPALGGAEIPEGAVVCAQCGQMFSPNDVIRYGDKAVCAACKPVFLQKLREGASSSAMGMGDMDYGGFWIRFAAKFLDGIIMQVIGGIVGGIAGVALGIGKTKDPNMAIGAMAAIYGLGFILDVTYRTVFLGMYGATPGKMVCKLRVVNVDGSKISYAKALGRALAEFLSGMICMIGYIMAAFDDEKRTLHDRICETRVVKV